jgi:hypothetical protein
LNNSGKILVREAQVISVSSGNEKDIFCCLLKCSLPMFQKMWLNSSVVPAWNCSRCLVMSLEMHQICSVAPRNAAGSVVVTGNAETPPPPKEMYQRLYLLLSLEMHQIFFGTGTEQIFLLPGGVQQTVNFCCHCMEMQRIYFDAAKNATGIFCYCFATTRMDPRN